MRRRLFTILSALSLVLCVVTLLLWSGAAVLPREFPHLAVRRDGSKLIRNYGGLGWNRSAFTFQRYEDHILFGQDYDAQFRLVGEQTPEDEADVAFSQAVESRQPPDRLNFYGNACQLRRDDKLRLFVSGPRKKAYGRATVLVLPFGPLALMTGVLPAIYIATRALQSRRGRRLPGLCPRCGYDLRATPGRCPECGTAAAGTEA